MSICTDWHSQCMPIVLKMQALSTYVLHPIRFQCCLSNLNLPLSKQFRKIIPHSLFFLLFFEKANCIMGYTSSGTFLVLRVQNIGPFIENICPNTFFSTLDLYKYRTGSVWCSSCLTKNVCIQGLQHYIRVIYECSTEHRFQCAGWC